ncbi:BON domain-containing protein [Ramlibacter sp. MMS24-I3-19]|uniref:BON domain-containing protein n=1 Tax=Ramlibacter sp. MMS24-I3-19 TaxID=3416606 RepID=UPI003CFF7E13
MTSAADTFQAPPTTHRAEHETRAHGAHRAGERAGEGADGLQQRAAQDFGLGAGPSRGPIPVHGQRAQASVPHRAAALSDAQIELDCRLAVNELGRHPLVQLLVTQGWVCVRGSVRYASERWKVEDAVSRVAGVVGVNAQLGVSNGSLSAVEHRRR